MFKVRREGTRRYQGSRTTISNQLLTSNRQRSLNSIQTQSSIIKPISRKGWPSKKFQTTKWKTTKTWKLIAKAKLRRIIIKRLRAKRIRWENLAQYQSLRAIPKTLSHYKTKMELQRHIRKISFTKDFKESVRWPVAMYLILAITITRTYEVLSSEEALPLILHLKTILQTWLPKP